jgi:hypothetical protein
MEGTVGKLWLGWSVVLLGLLGLGGLLSNAYDGGRTPFPLLILALLAIVGGLCAAWRGQREYRSEALLQRGATLDAAGEVSFAELALRAVPKIPGAITATRLAQAAGLSFSEAHDALNRLARAGRCQIRLGVDGLREYHFPKLGPV